MQQPDNYARLLAAHAEMSAGRYGAARAALEQLVSVGEHQALLYLGWMHERGLGSPVDEARAAACYQTVCDTGDQWGCYHAAYLKFRRRDIAGALELYVRAAEAGHPSAAYWASAIYDGEGGYACDPERATYYLVKAAECGHVFARRDLAKQRMRQPGRIRCRAFAALQYSWEVLKGFPIIAKDADDPRVR